MKKKFLILLAALLAVVLAVLFAFLLLYGPNFGVYLRKPSPQAYGERALAFMENGYYSSAEEWREAKATAQDALRSAQIIGARSPPRLARRSRITPAAS